MSALEKARDAGIELRATELGNHKAVCPRCSHERKKKKDPCLSIGIQADSIVVYCHHCQWSESFWDDDSAPRTYRQAAPARKHAKPVLTETPSTLTPAALGWFSKRGITPDTLEKNGVCLKKVWFSQTRREETAICFPYRREGDVVNVKYRGPNKLFRQEKNAEKIFFGLDDVDNAGKEDLIIVEGELDKLAMNEAGYWNTLSVPDGAPSKPLADDTAGDPDKDTKFSYVWNCREHLDRAKRVIIAVDCDGPGDALAWELARRIGIAKCCRVKWSDSETIYRKDANEVLVEDGPTVIRECIDAAKLLPIRSLYETVDYADQTYALYHGQIDRGESTGWMEMDKFMKIRPGELSIVTGYPSSGKSEFIDALSLNMARNLGWTFALCSFENPAPEHIGKLAQKYLGLPFHEGPTQRMSEQDLESAIAWINDHFYFIRSDDESPTLDWLLETAQAAVMRYGIRGLVIDPYNEMNHQRPVGMSETEYVSQMLGKVKRFAQNAGVHVWFIAHPAKPLPNLDKDGDVYYAIPSLYSISGSAHWVNKADVGVVVYRVWRKDGSETNEVEIHVKKVRFRVSGKPGVQKMTYNPASGRYTPIIDDEPLYHTDRGTD